MNPFLNRQRRLRNGWWILIFFLVLGALLTPLMILSRQRGFAVSPGLQAVVVAIVSIICQLGRRRAIAELVGPLDWRWLRYLFAGCAAGALLMLMPALLLCSVGCVQWRWNNPGALFSGIGSAAGVAITEELIFRGFIFQRLIGGLGTIPAQLICGAYFLIIHADKLGAAGNLKYLAALNIFVASIAFGLAFIRTAGLAAPIGIHFAANLTQGAILGLGVSGDDEPGLLTPIFNHCPSWLTGGTFGLEAALPGLASIVALAFTLFCWKGSSNRNPRRGEAVPGPEGIQT